jgi:mono/diheme cytochrome c family protein
MGSIFKIFGIFLLVVVSVAVAGIVYYNSHYPDVEPAKELSFEYTPELITRGAYLANHVAVCIDCHSDRDWTLYSGPLKPGTEGKGGERMGEELGLPGYVYTKNITPSAIGEWTDGELFRTIVSGVNKHNEVLFPIMPYPAYNQMAEEDIKAIIAYIRQLKPIENHVPSSSINFPVNMLIKSEPKNYISKPLPDKNNITEYGQYLVTIGACADCHSPADQGKPIPGKEFGGGFEIDLPFGTVRSANISPDMETGIGAWSKEVFIARFKYFLQEESTKMSGDKVQTIMPWTFYAGMTEEDLGAIYDYLRTVAPVKNKVVTFSPPNQRFLNTRK